MHKNEMALARSIDDLLATQTLATADAVPRRAMHAWRRLATQLTPYIGEAGFCALYTRALRLTQAEFDWLSLPPPAASPEALLDALTEALEHVDPLLAAQANARFLATFMQILSSLIGEGLATRILNSAWIAESDTKNTQENHK